MLQVAFQKRKKILIICIVGILIFVVLLGALAILTWKGIYNGIQIDGVDVAGMGREDAKIVADYHINKLLEQSKLVLTYEGRKWEFGLDAISLTALNEEAVRKAYDMGRKGTVFSRLSHILYLRFHKVNIQPKLVFDYESLKNILSQIKTQIDKKDENASVFYTNGKFEHKKHEIGFSLDIDKNIKLIENNIINKKFDEMVLIVSKKTPGILYDDIKEIDSVLATFSTVFNSWDIDRSFNIKLACSKINGMILLPKEIFSMNQALGPRTLENGYRDAPVIYKNELIKGPGGGVCQVSTTLYNAVLKSKIDIVERTHHSMPLGYVKPGQDATIAEDYIDLKFQNNKDYSVSIAAEVTGNTLIVRIIGKKDDKAGDVRLIPEVVEEYLPGSDEITIDNSLANDQVVTVREAKKGLKVKLFRYTYDKNRVLLEKELISEDIYKPVKRHIKVNQYYYDINMR